MYKEHSQLNRTGCIQNLFAMLYNAAFSGDIKGTPSLSSNSRTPMQRAKKALNKFIGSFKEGSDEPPPTRSWRNLQTLDSFDEFFAKFKSAKKETDLGNTRSEMKVFKSALNDLISLTRSANQGVNKAYESLQKKRDKVLMDTKSNKKAAEQKQSVSLMEFVMEKGKPFASKNIKEVLVPMGDLLPSLSRSMNMFIYLCTLKISSTTLSS